MSQIIISKQHQTAIEEAFLQQADLFQKTSHSTSPYVQKVRREAFANLEKLGLPGNKNEEYKYTRITRALNKHFAPENIKPAYAENAIGISQLILSGIEANILVFVNGKFSQQHSNMVSPPQEIIISTLSEAFESHTNLIERYYGKYADSKTDAFTALNTAVAEDGIFIYVPQGKVVSAPVLIYFITDTTEEKTVSQPRNLYIIEENSQVDLVESFHTVGEQEGYHNIVSEIVVNKQAVVNYHKIEIEGKDTYHTGNTHVVQTAESLFNAVTVSVSGGMIRNNLNLVIDAENCESHMYGLYMLDQETLVDNHTMVDHRKANSFSNELYKGIMDDKSKGVFNGKVYVRPDAQKTNAFQSNKNILLTDDASIDTKPQLEIWADDVKCSHGATTGQIDAEQLFYLQTRGLDKRQATALLLKAFASDVLQNIRIQPLREVLEKIISQRLQKDL